MIKLKWLFILIYIGVLFCTNYDLMKFNSDLPPKTTFYKFEYPQTKY